jgi:membrane protein required for colicin V production
LKTWLEQDMLWIDWAIVVVVALAVIGGLTQGFFRSFCSLGGLVLGLALAAWNYSMIAAPLKPIVHNEEIADIV